MTSHAPASSGESVNIPSRAVKFSGCHAFHAKPVFSHGFQVSSTRDEGDVFTSPCEHGAEIAAHASRRHDSETHVQSLPRKRLGCHRDVKKKEESPGSPPFGFTRISRVSSGGVLHLLLEVFGSSACFRKRFVRLGVPVRMAVRVAVLRLRLLLGVERDDFLYTFRWS